MTERSLPWEGTTRGDAVFARYSSSEWADTWARVIGYDGYRANSGVLLGNGTPPFFPLEVRAKSPASNLITLKIGNALVQGWLYVNDADKDFTVTANVAGNPRIDTLVLRLDVTEQTIRAILKPGVAAGIPTPPALTQSAGNIWEIPLVDIAVANGFSVINQTDISPRSLPVNAPGVLVLDNILNNSGGELNTGDLVVWDNTTDRAVTTTTIFNHPRIAGVWVGRTANGSYGRLQRGGIGLVRINASGAAVTRGTPLVTHTTAKQAVNPFAGATSLKLNWFEVARTLENVASGFVGLTPAIIEVHPPQGEDYVLLGMQVATGLTSGAWTTVSLSELRDTGGICSVAGGDISLRHGRYRCNIVTPGYQINDFQTKLIRVDVGPVETDLLWGSNGYSPAGGSVSFSHLRGYFESVSFPGFSLTGTEAFRLKARCTLTNATNAFGRNSGFGNEIFALAEFWRINRLD